MIATRLAAWHRMGRPFRLLLASDALMLLSIMFAHVAVPWWIAREGGAPHLALYGVVVGGMSFLALPLLAPLGDRISKRVLLTGGMATLMVVGLLMAGMAQFGHYRIGWILLLGALQTTAMAVINPVSLSIVAELLPPEQLTAGLGYQRSAQALGRLMGPVAGGAILAAADVASALWANAALLLLACFFAARIVVPLPENGARSVGQWVADLRAGLEAKWKIPMERGWTFVSFLVVVFFMPGVGMLLPLKVQSLGLSGAWLGACEAGLSIGLLVGSLGGSNWVAERIGRFRASVGAILVEGIAIALMGLTREPWLLVLALAVVGGGMATVQTVGHTHRMLAIPQHFRARMISVNMMALQVGGILGPALAGAGLALMHVDRVYLLCGIGLFLVGLGYRWVPGYRGFLNTPHADAAGYYAREYPALFGARAASEAVPETQRLAAMSSNSTSN